MGLVLPGKDLLVIGLWTDWGYLNDVFPDALNVAAFASVTVVDPAASAALQANAPNLGLGCRPEPRISGIYNLPAPTLSMNSEVLFQKSG